MQRLVLTGPLVRVMTCGDSARARWAPWLAAHDTPRHDLPDLPARADVDPVLADVPAGGRLAVAGDDAALAAVLVRLLRRERLDVAVALLPAPDSAAAGAWGLPTDPAAAIALARDGVAHPSPLVRDDHGGLVAGRHATGPFHGEVYCDEHLVARGDAESHGRRPGPRGRRDRDRHRPAPARRAARGARHDALGPRRAARLPPARARDPRRRPR